MNPPKKELTCTEMNGSDDGMDKIGWAPANPLPQKCSHCTFPDLDFVPEPYLLTKGIDAPAETAAAGVGNFLVRGRVRKILEAAVPGECRFHPTAARKGKTPTDWWLAVPVRKVKTPKPASEGPFCSKCGEPKNWFSATGPVTMAMCRTDTKGADIFKEAEWLLGLTIEEHFESTNGYRKKSGLAPLPWSHWGVEPPPHPERWTRSGLKRYVYFSVRVAHLLKRAGVKGKLLPAYSYKDMITSPEDEAWIAEKLKLLAEQGLVEGKPVAAKAAGTAQKWLAQYLKKNAKKSAKPANVAAVEKKHRLTLPQDYKDFIATVGPKSLSDVMEIKGFTANILGPSKLDFEGYRPGKVDGLDEEQSAIDGVMFASTDHGDAFVFDVSAKGDWPVLWHNHEENTLEPFAPNFAACVKRFVNKD